MSRLLNVTQCPIFAEGGDVKVTTDFGKNITDYPTAGKVGDHWGLDVVRCTDGKNSKLATIVAIADGIVFAQRKYVKTYDSNGKKIMSPSQGNCVYILHDDLRTITKYYHLADDSVPDYIKDNVRVKKGDVLGYMGNTGYSYGSHCHFQVEYTDQPITDINPKIEGTPIDPEPYLTGEKVIFPLKYIVYAEYETEAEAVAIATALQALGLPFKAGELE